MTVTSYALYPVARPLSERTSAVRSLLRHAQYIRKEPQTYNADTQSTVEKPGYHDNIRNASVVIGPPSHHT